MILIRVLSNKFLFKPRLRHIYFNMNSKSKENFSKNSDSNEPLENLIYIDKIPYTTVIEGKAEVLFPSSHDVFYNPVQEFNRDISIAVLKQFLNEIPSMDRGKYKKKNLNSETQYEINLLEALAASGLRSIRFAKEVPGLKRIVANDMCYQAYESIKRNIRHNKVENIIEPSNEEASLIMYKNRKFKDRFDVIDLDPYGTAAPFLDAAVQSIADGGLLMVTCTDMGILCGNGVEACHAKYGAVSIKIGSCHEMALRIVLQSIESHANRYGRYIEPLLSLSVDFYVRIFVQIFTAPILVKQSICKLAMVYVCSECSSYHLQPLGNQIKTDKGQKFSPGKGPPINMKCDICDGSHKICGPIWISRLHNKEFLKNTLANVELEKDNYKTWKRMVGILNVIIEELEDSPLFFKIDHLASTLHVVSPTNLQMRSAILNAGYKVSISHTLPTSIKTNAPQSVIWDIMKTWAKEHAGKKTFVNEPSKTIMSKEPSIEVSFKTHPDAEPLSRINNLLRFQVNPEKHWGPKCRATTSLFNELPLEKQERHQNKRKKVDNNAEQSSSKKK